MISCYVCFQQALTALALINQGQWLWQSWQSGRFRHLRFTVQIPTAAKIYLSIVNEEEEAGKGPLKNGYS